MTHSLWTPAWLKCIWHVAFFHEARHSSAVLRDSRQYFTLCVGVILNSKSTSKNTTAKNVTWNALEKGHSVRAETGRQCHQSTQRGEWTDWAGQGFGCSVQVWVTTELQELWLWAYKHLLAHGECAEESVTMRTSCEPLRVMLSGTVLTPEFPWVENKYLLE